MGVLQVVWLLVGLLAVIVGVIRLAGADRGACPILAVTAGVLLMLGATGVLTT